jgi:Tol biopolymer transport system component
VLPLTTLNGREGQPSFSPDGAQVAFSWDGGVEGTSHIYAKLVGSSEVRQLTTDHAFDDVAPSWSPDGRQIAFERFRQGVNEGRIHLMSSLGGPDAKLSEAIFRWPETKSRGPLTAASWRRHAQDRLPMTILRSISYQLMAVILVL